MSVSVRQSDWARLFRIACDLIDQVNASQNVIDDWSFGGGTAMMLHIDHRESHDVDIFLTDPQSLAFLDPKTHDFEFDLRPTDYDGDGAGFLKLAFKGVGEIDFIVGHALTAMPTTQRVIEGRTVALETIAEIITKKICHRGANIKPRDIFDIAAAGETHAESIIEALGFYKDATAATLARLDLLRPDFVNSAIADLAIKDAYKPIAHIAISRARQILRAV